jgi:hypothetical protein
VCLCKFCVTSVMVSISIAYGSILSVLCVVNFRASLGLNVERDERLIERKIFGISHDFDRFLDEKHKAGWFYLTINTGQVAFSATLELTLPRA